MAVTKRQNKAKKAENKNASVRVCFAVVALSGADRRENNCDARTGAFAGLSTSRP